MVRMIEGKGRPLAAARAATGHGFSALVDRWEAEETVLRRRGAAVAADVLASCLLDLRAAWEEHQLEELSLADGAAEAGMSYKGLQKAVAEGRVPNAGTKHRPRIRREDLPRKARAAHRR